MSKIFKICKNCNKTYKDPHYNKNRIYCSMKCSSEAKTKVRENNSTCEYCGKGFFKHLAYKKKSPTDFCSRHCYQESQKTNKYITKGDVTLMQIFSRTRGVLFVEIDTCMIDKVNTRTWSFERNNYVSSRGRKENVKLHRIITGCPDDMQVDHIDRNPMNNKLSNLRICTPAENSQNQSDKDGMRNITWLKRDNKWRVSLIKKGKIIIGGYFTNLEEAKKRAKELRDEHFTHHTC